MRDHPTDAPRFGRRKISGMLKDWNALRAAVRCRDLEAAETALDRCEEWIDFAFGAATSVQNLHRTPAHVSETPDREHVAQLDVNETAFRCHQADLSSADERQREHVAPDVSKEGRDG